MALFNISFSGSLTLVIGARETGMIPPPFVFFESIFSYDPERGNPGRKPEQLWLIIEPI